jgi:hypothetical protein
LNFTKPRKTIKYNWNNRQEEGRELRAGERVEE